MERAVLRRGIGLGLATLGLVATATFGGCFAPREPACAFSCGPGDACPTDYACGTDNVCHRVDGLGMCLIAPQNDGGPSGADAAADAGDGAAD